MSTSVDVIPSAVNGDNRVGDETVNTTPSGGKGSRLSIRDRLSGLGILGVELNSEAKRAIGAESVQGRRDINSDSEVTAAGVEVIEIVFPEVKGSG